LGAISDHGTSSQDNFGSVLSGGSAYAHMAVFPDTRTLVDPSEAQASFAQWFARKSVSGEKETGPGQAGLGDSGPDRVRPAPGPLFGSPYIDGTKPSVTQSPWAPLWAATSPN